MCVHASGESMINEFDEIIAVNAAKYGVPFDWIKAVMMTESSGNPMAFRDEPAIGDASYGLMQLLYRTARGLGYTGEAIGLYDPMISLDLGTKLIAQIRRQVGEDFEAMYSAYNSGDPSAYKDSSQVAAHVANADSWLERVRATLGDIAGVVTTEDSSVIFLMIAAGMAAYLIFWR